MSWHEFVFSEKRPQRYIRHIVFWLLWWMYFFASMNLLPKQTNAPQRIQFSIQSFPDIVHSVTLVLIHMLACYVFIYFLLPRFLLTAKYFLLITAIILLGFVIVQATRFIDTIIVPLISGPENFKIPYYTSVYMGLLSAIKIIAVATAIKLVKHWWLKQQEKKKLEKERIESELQLLKTQIHPGFLFTTLNNIYSFALIPSPNAPQMILKLSDILSYMLYECNEREVALEKEIRMLNDYIALEMLRLGENLEVNMQVKGDVATYTIAPLLLLGFVENSFKQSNNNRTEQPWINLDIKIENDSLIMKLMNGKPVEKIITEYDEENGLAISERRLQLLYPERYELKIVEEPDIMMVSLRVQLRESLRIVEPAHREISAVMSL